MSKKIFSIIILVLLFLTACSEAYEDTQKIDNFTYDEVSFLFFNDIEEITEVELYSPKALFVDEPSEIILLYEDQSLLTIDDSNKYDIDGNTIHLRLDSFIPRFDKVILKSKDRKQLYDIGLYVFEPLSSHLASIESNDMEIWLDDYISSEMDNKTISNIVFTNDLSYDYNVITPASNIDYISNDIQITSNDKKTTIILESVLNDDFIHSNGIKYFTYESYIIATNTQNNQQKIVLKQYIPTEINE